MRVLLVTGFPDGTGVGNYARDLAHGLSENGAQTRLFYVNATGGTSAPALAHIFMRDFIVNASRVSRGFDVIHDTSLGTSLFGLRRRRKIVTIHDILPLTGRGELPAPSTMKFSYIASILAARLSSAIVVPTHYAARELNNWGVNPRNTNIVHIPYGVDTNRFLQRDSADCRAPLGLPADKFLFLNLGHARPRKNFGRLLQAFRATAKKLYDTQLVRVGLLRRESLQALQ